MQVDFCLGEIDDMFHLCGVDWGFTENAEAEMEVYVGLWDVVYVGVKVGI